MNLKGQIVVYSLTGCPHCLAAKSTLRRLNLNFTEVGIDKFPPYVRDWLIKKTGKSSVPQIFFNAQHIGGNSELQDLVANKTEEFQRLLRELKENAPPLEDGPLLPNPSELLDTPSASSVECEVDDSSVLVEELLRMQFVKTRRPRFLSSSVKNSFYGKDFVDWYTTAKAESRDDAVSIGQSLIEKKFIRGHDSSENFADADNALYFVITFEKSEALNTDRASKCVQRPASDVGEDLRRSILNLFSKFLSGDGKEVDYDGIKASETFEEYKTISRELQRVNLEEMTHNEKLSFFLNIYNALVIHGNIQLGTPQNMWQRYKFFSNVSYNIAGYDFSLNDIENGILRANKSSFGTLFRTPFDKSDARKRFSLKSVDARIHFGLNCGAKSCPPIKTFSAQDIDKELNLATRAFLESDDGFTISPTNEIHLSMLFKWYSSDFGNTEEDILIWILGHLPDDAEKKSQMKVAIDSKDYKVKYLHYDWDINKKN